MFSTNTFIARYLLLATVSYLLYHPLFNFFSSDSFAADWSSLLRLCKSAVSDIEKIDKGNGFRMLTDEYPPIYCQSSSNLGDEANFVNTSPRTNIAHRFGSHSAYSSHCSAHYAGPLYVPPPIQAPSTNAIVRSTPISYRYQSTTTPKSYGYPSPISDGYYPTPTNKIQGEIITSPTVLPSTIAKSHPPCPASHSESSKPAHEIPQDPVFQKPPHTVPSVQFTCAPRTPAEQPKVSTNPDFSFKIPPQRTPGFPGPNLISPPITPPIAQNQPPRIPTTDATANGATPDFLTQEERDFIKNVYTPQEERDFIENVYKPQYLERRRREKEARDALFGIRPQGRQAMEVEYAKPMVIDQPDPTGFFVGPFDEAAIGDFDAGQPDNMEEDLAANSPKRKRGDRVLLSREKVEEPTGKRVKVGIPIQEKIRRWWEKERREKLKRVRR
ncbi:hypothetical protein HK098_000933 [Nowakowskiella sp. JEL0407]|nr:hypothetical protein HK098_000933 [Nowakowskiella sp. JEL0407]